MAFNYPNGRRFDETNFNRPIQKSVSQSNRGMSLESDLNHANQYYLATNRAVIHKKPTPIQIVKVNYPDRSAAKITEAYFRQASTTDYNGVYQGYYIDFDAKETSNKTSFPLKNVHEHQIVHLKQVTAQGGLAFMIIRFTTLQETYVIWAELLFNYWDMQVNQRKSIPYEQIVKYGELVPIGVNPQTPYLDAIDTLINQL